MLAKVLSGAVNGLDASLVQVEVDIAPGLPAFHIVGLPDAAVQESKERVRSAIRNSGAAFPTKRVTTNLAPADTRKEGPAYDLPIAIGVLAATGQVDFESIRCMFLGELSLDGAIRPANGVLLLVGLAREAGLNQVFVPAENAREAALVPGATVIPAAHLREVIDHLNGLRLIPPQPFEDIARLSDSGPYDGTDFADIKGQEHVKRALEVAAAGSHNVAMTGPPGSGKTLLARALPSILPSMSIDEALEATKIYSVAGLLRTDQPLIRRRPFRAPHHTISYAGLVGGGRNPRPGEISLANRGVLFLDELPEFPANALEALRQPLEDKLITISRAQGAIIYPANVMLVAAQNPCPCGYAGDPLRQCTCSASSISRYQKRISGPLLDRIDIHLDVPRVEYEKLSDERLGEHSSAIRTRVETAREIQRARFVGSTLLANAEMGPAEIRQFCRTDSTAQSLLKAAVTKLQLSGRAYHRVLKLARTIADLAGSTEIGAAHVAEAVQYRPKRSFA